MKKTLALIATLSAILLYISSMFGIPQHFMQQQALEANKYHAEIAVMAKNSPYDSIVLLGVGVALFIVILISAYRAHQKRINSEIQYVLTEDVAKKNR